MVPEKDNYEIAGNLVLTTILPVIGPFFVYLKDSIATFPFQLIVHSLKENNSYNLSLLAGLVISYVSHCSGLLTLIRLNRDNGRISVS